MRSLFISGALLALALAFVNADDVLVLTDSNFNDEVGKHDVLLIEFYAPWCGHCKRLEPEYAAAATELLREDPPIHIAKVDCIDAGKETCSKFSVSGFPTLKLFRAGEFSNEYDGGRTTGDIVRYMKSKAGPVSKFLETVKNVEDFTTSRNEPVVVGFFTSDSSDGYKSFHTLASAKSEDFKFGHAFNDEILKKFGYTDKIVIFRPKALKNKFEEQQEVHKTGDLTYWFNKNIYGLTGIRTPSNSLYFPSPLVTAYFKVDYDKNAKGTQYWRNRVMKVAAEFKDDFTFAVAAKTEFDRELNEFGLQYDGSADEVLVTLKNEKGQKFPMKEKFSVDTFQMFIKSYLDGKLEPYLKSEPIPDTQHGHVKVVVAKNFDEIVNDKTKDVLIEFYAPWCGHCKNLEPKYNELAEKLKDEEHIVIAKMDATANDVPSPYNVKGFPTIYFAPKDAKDSPKLYQGGREVKDFMDYLGRESTLTGSDKKKKTEL